MCAASAGGTAGQIRKSKAGVRGKVPHYWARPRRDARGVGPWKGVKCRALRAPESATALSTLVSWAVLYRAPLEQLSGLILPAWGHARRPCYPGSGCRNGSATDVGAATKAAKSSQNFERGTLYSKSGNFCQPHESDNRIRQASELPKRFNETRSCFVVASYGCAAGRRCQVFQHRRRYGLATSTPPLTRKNCALELTAPAPPQAGGNRDTGTKALRPWSARAARRYDRLRARRAMLFSVSVSIMLPRSPASAKCAAMTTKNSGKQRMKTFGGWPRPKG